jgi:hypothetical protein
MQRTAGIDLLRCLAGTNRRSSDTTGWRWAKAGWLHPINIGGRPHLKREDIQAFLQRAERGEFARAPRGAAGRSIKTEAV